MKNTLVFALLLGAFLFPAKSQKDISRENFNGFALEKKQAFIIQKLRSDTLLYSKDDIYHTPLGTQNRNAYSELYVINGEQYFRFDIVSGKCIEEFITAYLRKAKLTYIHKLSLTESRVLYGRSGEKGVTVILVKNLNRLKTENCRFIRSLCNSGNNFEQWKKGDIMIRN